ncbi:MULTISPECIES: SusC/RagA family TonB-linked outer membrane protein [Prevotellaceae]|uniref:SusC/RagA family TonB-linked outer membrane protein n=1 Tax=Prevotellaceae TaxID=171552 RepID=UPI0012B5A53F|nr:TonB-dependent receptor [Prevotella phocaeensis]
MLQQQRKTIRGIVTDANNEPLVGVSITEKGTSNAYITNAEGRFEMQLNNANASLVVSYVGFVTQTVRAQSNMRIVMKEDSKALNEVVVVGYGSQKKANLTGAVTSVDVEKSLSSRPIADIGRGLQGVVPGMNIRVPTGEVGSDPLIKIRGQIGSIEGSSAPLILLDNVEIPSIQMVNPNDVQSISVLKDAASSSIYGSKAAFGVVLITTKSGANSNKFEVTYSNNFSWQSTAKKLEMGGVDGLQYTLDAQINRGAPMPAGGFWRITPESMVKIREWQARYGGTVKWNDPVLYGRDWTYDGVNKYGYRIYDGIKAMVRDWAPMMTHNLSVNGKAGNTSYNVGLGYLNQTGMMRTAKHDDFRRYNASINIISEINKYVSIRASSIYSDRNKRYPGVGTTSADPWLYLYRWSPLFPIGVTSNGNQLREPSYELGAANTDNLQDKYFNVSLGFTLNFTKDWDMKVDYTYDRQTRERNSSAIQFRAGQIWYEPIEWKENGFPVYVNEDGQVTDTGGIPAWRFPVADYYSNVTTNYVRNLSRGADNNTFNAYTTYRLWLGSEKEHAFKFMLGMNEVTNNWSYHIGRKTGLIDQSNPQFPLASGEQFIEGDRNWEAQLGFFGRINYAFADRYLLEGNLRRDGSSKFPKHLRWKWFPSFSAGWVFTNEPIAKPLTGVLSFGKVRASWGSIGDQTVPNTLYRSVLEDGTSNWLDGTNKKPTIFGTPSIIDNNISWQRIETLDFGADLRFWNNQIGVTFDWFKRDTKDMIIPGESLPVTLGTSAPKGNYGNLQTKGWELALDFNHRFTNGLGVSVNVSVSDATTFITKGADYLTPWENRSLNNGYSTGRRYGDIYGFVTDRLFQKEDFVYDANGKIVTTNVIYKGTLRRTNLQTAPYPVYQVHYEDGDKLIFSPGDVKFVDIDGDGYITPGSGTNGDPGDQTVIGNSTPRYEYSFRIGLDYKGFDLSVYCQGIGKRKIWGAGQLAIAGFSAKEGAIPKTFATDYWREDRTDAFYPRAWDLGGSNTGFSMQCQSKYLLNMAYLRIKNINVGYSFPQNWLSRVGLTKARVYLSLENFFTFDHLRGLPIDPEAISGYSMFSESYNLSRTGTGTPIFKSLSCGVQLSF